MVAMDTVIPRRRLFLFMIMGGLMLNIIGLKRAEAQIAPALFVFGDSLVDVGNNNHLPMSLAKANFPHNGLDFPAHKPTGRFSNGKNAADFIAEKLGLPSSPPYLSEENNKSFSFLTGVSFASGGAGILDGPDKHIQESITMNEQVEYFGKVQGKMVQNLGQGGADKILSKAVFVFVVGSNDIFNRFGSSGNSTQSKKGDISPQEYVDSMLLGIKSQLKRIYDLGGRKFAMIGITAVGCCPAERVKSKVTPEACNDVANLWAFKYNQGLLSLLQDYKSQLPNFQYSFFDTYAVLNNLLQQPATYGFKEVKAACCGRGKLNANLPCLPIASYCSNRSDHIFWDLYHPTEAAARIIVDTAFDGPIQYAFPINIRQLASA